MERAAIRHVQKKAHSLMSSLVLRCPHCGQAGIDLFECLDHGVIGPICCEGCGRKFLCLLLECLKCANEDVFTWIQAPSETEMKELACSTCGQKTSEEGGELDDAK